MIDLLDVCLELSEEAVALLEPRNRALDEEGLAAERVDVERQHHEPRVVAVARRARADVVCRRPSARIASAPATATSVGTGGAATKARATP